MSRKEIRELANYPVLTQIAERLLRTTAVPYKATLFEKTGKANWLVAFHQDTALPVVAVPRARGWGAASVKDGVIFAHAPTHALQKVIALRIHLDDSTIKNGPLRVIPDSHSERVVDDADFERVLKSRKPYDCVIEKGGVIAMSPLILHASSKSTTDSPRRVLHIEYAESLDIVDGMKLAIA